MWNLYDSSEGKHLLTWEDFYPCPSWEPISDFYYNFMTSKENYYIIEDIKPVVWNHKTIYIVENSPFCITDDNVRIDGSVISEGHAYRIHRATNRGSIICDLHFNIGSLYECIHIINVWLKCRKEDGSFYPWYSKDMEIRNAQRWKALLGE